MRTHEVCSLTGCTFRQLDHWVHRRFVKPSDAPGVGSGRQREWSAEDAVMVAVMVRLVNAGLSPEVAATFTIVPQTVSRTRFFGGVDITIDVEPIRREITERLEATAP